MTQVKLTGHAPRFETLEGIRGCGALCIVAGHSLMMWSNLPGHDLIGTMMIDIFFVLSGFVLAFAYEPKFGERPSAWKFMRSRLVRLYPLYFLGSLLGFLVAIAIMYGESGDWLKPISQMGLALFMLPAVTEPESIFPLNFPAWTLFCELLVNLVYVLVWRKLTGRLLTIFIVLGGLGLIATVVVFGTMNMGSNFEYSLIALTRAWFGFFIGVAIYRYSARSRTKPLPRNWGGLAILLVAVPAFFIPLDGELTPFIEVGLVCIGSPLIIYLSQKVDPPVWVGRVFVWLGAISYAVYMLHWPIYIASLRLLEKLHLTFEQVAPFAGVALMLVVIAVAMLAERYYDRPVRAWIGEKLRGAQRSPEAALAKRKCQVAQEL